MKKKWFICVWMILSLSLPVLAADIYVEIGSSHWSVDSFNGVAALYTVENNSDADPVYSCAAYVKRYYQQIYGVEVMNLFNDGPPVASGGQPMVQAAAPMEGDIIFWPLKNNATNHSAIVKQFDGQWITLIEQNYKYDGKAVFERKIAFPGERYEIWRLAETDGAIQDKWLPAESQETIFDIPVVENYVRDEENYGYPALAAQVRPEKSFADVAENHWAYNFIVKASQLGLLSGYEDNTFRPEHNITRAEFAVVLSKVTGYYDENNTQASFLDVLQTDWFMPYVEFTKSKIFGDYYADGSAYFRPQDPLTRQEMCAAVALWKGYVISFDDTVLSGFKDNENISSVYRPYVAACVQAGALSGFDDGTIRGEDPVTRAQLAALMVQLYSGIE